MTTLSRHGGLWAVRRARPTGRAGDEIASSFHPGGVNCAFAEGSVRFIKDSIDAWPNTAANGFGPPPNLYSIAPTFPYGSSSFAERKATIG